MVTVAGYSPYKTIGELMDPAGVENDPNRWGFITRLMHLETIVDGNSPFKLYKRTDVKHFKLDTDDVDLNDAEMPVGIGLEVRKKEKGKSEKEKGEQVLIDPQTAEIISKVAELDEEGKVKFDRSGKVVYKINDHWFLLNAKFIWKDAPNKIDY